MNISEKKFEVKYDNKRVLESLIIIYKNCGITFCITGV